MLSVKTLLLLTLAYQALSEGTITTRTPDVVGSICTNGMAKLTLVEKKAEVIT